MINPAQFTDFYPPLFGIPWSPKKTQKDVESWETERIRKYVETRTMVENGQLTNPISMGWTLPSWNLVMDNFTRYKNHILLGGNRCLRGDTLIYDPVLHVSRRIDEIEGPHHVLSWNGERAVVAEAEQPFPKGNGLMLKIRLSNGSEFVAAPEHRVLSSQGFWLSCAQLQLGDALCRPLSTLDNDPTIHAPSVLRSSGRPPDSQGGCRHEFHLRDGRPQSEEGIDQDVFPSPCDAPKHRPVFDSSRPLPSPRDSGLRANTSDALDSKFSRIRASQLFVHPPILDGLLPSAAQSFDIQSCASCTPCISTLRLRESPASHVSDQRFAAEFHRLRSIRGSDQRDNQFCHDVAYIVGIEPEGIDVRWDMTVPSYGNYLTAGVVHHNSGKSTFTARLAVRTACTIPAAEVHLYQVNKEKSVNEQQRYTWDATPLSIKAIPTKKGQNHSIQWSQKNGYTDGVCIFPPHSGARRGGYMQFHNYAQFADDPNTAESFKAHLIVLDEECPLDLFKTLQYRTVDYRGRIILGFTTIQGWSPLVQHVLGRTKTLKSAFAPLIGKELPLMQESLSCPDTAIYYAWTEQNAFIDVEDFRKTMKGKPRDEILARAYGVPVKSVSGVFPAFSREIAPLGNVVKHEDLPFIKKADYKVTRYFSIDPAGSKNWFLAWVAIDAAGTWWVYREWPDYDDWALPGDKAGPAQRGSKRGIKDYVELITAAEGDEKIYERYIDPRLGAAEKQSADGATTIISELDDQNFTVIAAPGVDIDNGLQILQNLLAYDDSKPISVLNAPKLYVSDRCPNIIFALENYTAKLGLSENAKDPVDSLRYIAVSNAQYYEETKDTADHPTGVY